MALTTDQRARVRYYLGYSDVSQGGAPNRLEMAMTALTSGAETIVVDLLSQLATVDASLTTVSAATRAGIIEVDNGGVKWASNGMSASSAVSRQGRMLCGRLASMFGVTLGADVYGGGASPSFGLVSR